MSNGEQKRPNVFTENPSSLARRPIVSEVSLNLSDPEHPTELEKTIVERHGEIMDRFALEISREEVARVANAVLETIHTGGFNPIDNPENKPTMSDFDLLLIAEGDPQDPGVVSRAIMIRNLMEEEFIRTGDLPKRNEEPGVKVNTARNLIKPLVETYVKGRGISSSS